MSEDLGLAGIGSLALVGVATGALFVFTSSIITALALAGLLALTLFGLLLVCRRFRDLRSQLIDRDTSDHGAGGTIDLLGKSAKEVASSRKLREAEAGVLQMIAADRNTKTVLQRITGILAEQYPGSRFRIVADDLFDQDVVDQRWPIVPKTETEVGWVLQAVLREGEKPDDQVVNIAIELARLALDKARHQTALRYQADHDSLTGLLSRRAVLDGVDSAIGLGRSIGLVYCDVDKFKEINDTLGHQVGDQLLVAIADRLREAAEEAPFLCEPGRIGGDEYLLVAMDATTAEITNFVEALSFAMQAPFSFTTATVSTSLSIGASFHDQGKAKPEPAEILREADLALYQVKRSGRNGFRFFDSELRAIEAETKLLEQDLRQSISNRSGLFSQFQPQFDANKELVGFEALGRWTRQGVGMISPADFIPVAVERGMMAQLDLEMFRGVAQTVSNLRREGRKFGKMSVNVSAERLEDADFVESTLDVLRKFAIDPTSVVLEITESSLVDDLRERGRRLEILRAWGVRIAIDDFGTGYSSLSYLRELPVDIVKLDREFVSEIDTSEMSQAIVKAILTLSSVLELEVVAEGIERESQFDILKDLGCDIFQGFLLGRPLPHDAARDLAEKTWLPDPFGGGYEWPDAPPSLEGIEKMGQLPAFKTL